jgi:hypothetical protein
MDVRRLEIAMNDTERVRFVKRAADRAHDREHLAPRQRSEPAKPLEQALAVEQLHRDVQRSIAGFAALVGDHRVRILKPRERLALAHEARGDLRVVREVRVQDLECERGVARDVGRAIDRAEATVRDLLVDAIDIVDEIADRAVSPDPRSATAVPQNRARASSSPLQVMQRIGDRSSSGRASAKCPRSRHTGRSLQAGARTRCRRQPAVR